MTRHAVTYASFTATVAAFVGLALVLLSGGPHPAAHASEVFVMTQPAATPEADADAAFLADLFGPDTDVAPEQATALTELGRRVATLLTHPEQVPPGAEVPTREAFIATMTLPEPSLTTGFSPEEAAKLIDCALAAYAPPAV